MQALFSHFKTDGAPFSLTPGQALFLGSIGASLTISAPSIKKVLDTVVNGHSRKLQPPKAKLVHANQFFGVNLCNPEEFRGDKAMNPPLTRNDSYGWLRDSTRKDPEVLNYLAEENRYTESELHHLRHFRSDLYNEMLSHLKEDDEEVPYHHGHFLYHSKTVKGLAYKIHCRRPVAGGEEEVVLDENKVAKGYEFCSVGSWEPSPTHRLLAYSMDTTGYETFSVRVLDLTNKQETVDVIEGTCGTIVWGADDSTFFYSLLDDGHRPYKVFLHTVGTPQNEDICLFTEDDGRFWLDLQKTSDDRYLILGTGSKETSECYFVDLNQLSGAVQHRTLVAQRLICFQSRRQGLRYEDIDHFEGQFFIVTNKDGSMNNKIVRVPVSEYTSNVGRPVAYDWTAHWIDIRPYNNREQVDSIQAFRDHLVIYGRSQGFSQIWIVKQPRNNESLGDWEGLRFPEQAYNVWKKDNYVYDTDVLRIGYSSFLTPVQVQDYVMSTGVSTVLKEQTVPGYDASKYECRRIEAKSRDGKTCIPISMVFHKSLLNAKTLNHFDESSGEWRRNLSRPENCLHMAPCLLYGYGSYGMPMDPTFEFKRLSLLDRGVVFAIAHIRGGGEFGRSWYEVEGKYLNKMNTFHDFADCAKALISQQITSPDRLAIMGRSAGGLLIGAAVNMYPTLFKAAVGGVPFVDVLNTMSDPTIPLTITEWEEWGNPNEAEYFDYIKRYSPYDNIKPHPYPAILFTAGLNDPRVPYWEAAKFTAKLRANKLPTDPNPVYLKTDLSSGHFSASDRYKYLRESAFEYAFLLDQLNAKDLV